MFSEQAPTFRHLVKNISSGSFAKRRLKLCFGSVERVEYRR